MRLVGALLLLFLAIAGSATLPETSEVVSTPANLSRERVATSASLVPGASHHVPASLAGGASASEGLVPGAVPAPDTATLQRFTATWCAPTPRYCKGWGGDAHVAAVRSFRFGDEPYWVRVSRVTSGEVRSTVVRVVSFCACMKRGGRPSIDMSPAAFRELGPLSRGVLRVTVERIDGVPTKLPETDVIGG